MNKSIEFVSQVQLQRDNFIKGIANTEIKFTCTNCLTEIIINVNYETVEESFKYECLCGKKYIITKVSDRVYLFLIKNEKITTLKAKVPENDLAVKLGSFTLVFLVMYIVFNIFTKDKFYITSEFKILLGLAFMLFFAIGFKLQDYD